MIRLVLKSHNRGCKYAKFSQTTLPTTIFHPEAFVSAPAQPIYMFAGLMPRIPRPQTLSLRRVFAFRLRRQFFQGCPRMSAPPPARSGAATGSLRFGKKTLGPEAYFAAVGRNEEAAGRSIGDVADHVHAPHAQHLLARWSSGTVKSSS